MPMPASPTRLESKTSMPQCVYRVDNEHYIDPEFLVRERARVFGRSWLIAARSSTLPDAGNYVVLDELGESILLVRDPGGAALAFHNVCRHRGSRLLEGTGQVSDIACPYHGWRFALDGKATSIPRREGLRGELKEGSGLDRVRCAEWGGFVWICMDDDAPSLAAHLGEVADELAPYRLEEFRPIQQACWDIPVNWKAFLENASDFNHMPFVHKQSIASHVGGVPDIHSYGMHSRQRLEIAAYPWRQRLDRMCSRGGPYSPVQASALHKYLLFPNTILNVLPYHMTLMEVFPVAPDRTRLHYTFAGREGAWGVEWLRAQATWLASRYILYEDMKLLERYQQGLNTGRREWQVLHEEEQVSARFHGTLARYLSDNPAPWTP
jgi:phenylpropionate dioxygenase-like ring-hydroxylating dioxygenase large terminal subunit